MLSNASRWTIVLALWVLTQNTAWSNTFKIDYNHVLRILSASKVEYEKNNRFLQSTMYPTTDGTIESTLSPECQALADSADQCMSRMCLDCFVSEVDQLIPDSGTVVCAEFEPSFCAAIVTCDCSACQAELEAAFSCVETCGQIDCPEPTVPPTPGETQGPTLSPECEALLESAQQCVASSNPSCGGCIDSVIEDMLAGSDSVSCSQFETDICAAMIECDCTDCQTELEAFYSCGQTCDPVDCPEPTVPPTQGETQGPTLPPECETLMESVRQCISSSNPSCAGCFDSSYANIFAGSDTVDCTFGQKEICDAVITCECTDCQEEIELAYSCGQPCDPINCSDPTPSPINTTPASESGGGTPIAAVCGVIGAILVVGIAIGSILLCRRKKPEQEGPSKVEIRSDDPTNDVSHFSHPTTSASSEPHWQEPPCNNLRFPKNQSSYYVGNQCPIQSVRSSSVFGSSEQEYNIPMQQSPQPLTTKDHHHDPQYGRNQPTFPACHPKQYYSSSCNSSTKNSGDGGFMPSFKHQCQTVISVPMAVAVMPDSGLSQSSRDP